MAMKSNRFMQGLGFRMTGFSNRIGVWLSPVLIAVAVILAGFQPSRQPEASDDVEDALQAVVEEAVSRGAPGAALHVERAGTGWSWSGAAGYADPSQRVPMSPQNPVRMASVTKTFVAVAILRLWEQERIEIDGPIRTYLQPETLRILRDGGYDPDVITVRHLLTHTSGLFDYADCPQYMELYLSNVHRRWTRAEQLEGAMSWGKPYGKPGEFHHYADTGYILLGEMLELETGLSMGAALRKLLDYPKIGLESTWQEIFEPTPDGVLGRAHQFESGMDTYGIDPSIDLYGGGGLVSTVKDLTLFMQATFTDQVFARPSTRELMLSPVTAAPHPDSSYGHAQSDGTYRMGISVHEIDGITVYQHNGYWGTSAVYVPSLRVAMAATINLTEEPSVILGNMIRQALAALSADRSGPAN
jgi:D-alanyl-D-alanine carboxypeptidase